MENNLEPPHFGGRTLADRAFEWLEEAIIKGTYPAGTKLDEVLLAKSFGISRGPVREAIRRLEGKKLVERVPHVGARVARLGSSGLINLLHVREALEGMACRLATEHMSDAELEDLEELLRTHASQINLQSGDDYYQKPMDRDFHFRLIKGSRNEKLIEPLPRISIISCEYTTGPAPAGRAMEAREHEAIVAAMKRRDPDAAEAARSICAMR